MNAAAKRASRIASNAVLVGVVAIMFFSLAATAPAKGPRCTITGTTKDDVLRGSKERDVICARGGADRVFGLAGNDVLRGGGGNDRLVGGRGGDRLFGGPGSNRMIGGPGRDMLRGGGRANVARGSSGADVLYGHSADDELHGEGGDDTLYGHPSDDHLYGEAGDDQLDGGRGDDYLNGGSGDDVLEGGEGQDVLDDGEGDSATDEDAEGESSESEEGGAPADGSGGTGCDTGESADEFDVSCDKTAPELVSFSLTPTAIDTSESDRTTAVTARITDDLAGNAGEGYRSSPSQVTFVSPSGNQQQTAMLDGRHRTSGTATDGIYEFEMTIPRYAEPGEWKVAYLWLVDQVGNTRRLSAADLSAAGFPSSFQQTGPGDSGPPELASFSFDPESIDTSSASQTITVRAHITDDFAGNAGEGYRSSPSQVTFLSPSGNQQQTAMLDGRHRTSGTATDGIYEFEMTIPRYAEPGEWKVAYLWLVDQVGNTRRLSAADLSAAGFPSSFQQTGPGDTTPPSLVSLSLSPAQVDTSSGAQTITVSARITDDLAGNAGEGYRSSPSQMTFVSPSRNQQQTAMLDGRHRTSGTATDGTYEYRMQVPQYSECGVWSVHHLMLVDQVGNTQRLSAADLEAAGFPSSFTNC